ncbi:MAG: hypothetical protein ABJF88_05650 [Rhodothermales bacterium]
MLHPPARKAADADVRDAFGPLATERLMAAVDSYIPTPDATENPPPSGG